MMPVDPTGHHPQGDTQKIAGSSPVGFAFATLRVASTFTKDTANAVRQQIVILIDLRFQPTIKSYNLNL